MGGPSLERVLIKGPHVYDRHMTYGKGLSKEGTAPLGKVLWCAAWSPAGRPPTLQTLLCMTSSECPSPAGPWLLSQELSAVGHHRPVRECVQLEEAGAPRVNGHHDDAQTDHIHSETGFHLRRRRKKLVVTFSTLLSTLYCD